MKKIFIDCGTHMFQGFEQFVQSHNITNEWECYSFEANPHTHKLAKDKHQELIQRGYNVQHFNKAVSNKNGKIKVNCALAYAEDMSSPNTFTSQGSNILENRPENIGWPQHFSYDENFQEVESINLSQFIKDNFSSEDYILIKMDIEGAEYATIDKIIEDDVIDYIDEMYVEYHPDYFDDREKYLQKRESYKVIFSNKNSNIIDWH